MVAVEKVPARVLWVNEEMGDANNISSMQLSWVEDCAMMSVLVLIEQDIGASEVMALRFSLS